MFLAFLQVDGLATLILCAGVVVAAGNEPFRLGNYNFHRMGQVTQGMYMDPVEASMLQPNARKCQCDCIFIFKVKMEMAYYVFLIIDDCVYNNSKCQKTQKKQLKQTIEHYHCGVPFACRAMCFNKSNEEYRSKFHLYWHVLYVNFWSFLKGSVPLK